MKKNLKNKQVIRAISVGLSAMMALSPVTAYAAEGEDGSSNPIMPTQENTVKTDEVKAAEAAQDASNAVGTVDTTITGKDGVLDAAAEAAKDKESGLPSAGFENLTETDTTKVDQDIEDAADALGRDDSLEHAEAELKGDAANQTVEGAKENLEAADKAKEDAADAAGDAKYDVEAIEKVVGSNSSMVDTANNDADQAILAISGATTIAGADAAKADFDQILKDAEESYNKNKTDYETLTKDYDAQLAALKQAQADFDAAKAQAGADTAAAEADLVAAQNKLDSLKTAAEAAAELMATDAAVIIANAQEARDKGNAGKNTDWKACDALFKEIVERYYGAVKLGLSEVKTDSNFTNFSKDDGNYIIVSGKDQNGNQVTKYLNYKLDSATKQLLIFEKSQDVFTGLETENAGFVYLDGDQVAMLEKKGSLQEKIDKGEIVPLTDESGVTTYIYKIAENAEKTSELELKENQSVDEASKKTDIVFDEQTGELVQKVTGDVTTVTYTPTTVTGTEKYASEAAAKEAAVAAQAGLTGKDFTVTAEATTTYSTVTTYTPVFTITINLNNVNSKYKTDVLAKHEIEGDFRGAVDDLNLKYEVGTTDNLSSTDHYHTVLFGMKVPDDDTVSGTLTVSFVANDLDTTKDTTKYSILGDLFGISSSKDDVQAKLEKEAEKNGDYLYNLEEWDWNLGKATATTIEGKTLTDNTEYSSAQEAVTAAGTKVDEAISNNYSSVLNALMTKLKKAFKGGSVAASYSTNVIKNTVTTSNTTYNYKIDYQKEESNIEEDALLSTTTWKAAEVRKLGNNVVAAEKYDIESDADFKKYVETATAKKANYDALLAKIATANSELTTAKGKVTTLQAQINNLKKEDYSGQLADLKAKLDKAIADWEAAEAKYQELVDKADDAEQEYNDIVDEIRAAQEVDTDDTTPADTDAPTVPVGNVTVIPGAATPLAAAPAAGRTRGTGAGNAAQAQNVVAIGEEPVALAEAPAVDEEKDDKTTIKDNDIPLSELPTFKKSPFAWWLLLLAALGIGGYEGNKQYRKRKAAKAEAAEEETEE